MAQTNYTAPEKDLNTIIGIYHKYSHKSGKEDDLEINELEGFIKEEAPGFLKSLKKENISLDDIFKKADLNNDTHLSFPEFVAVLALICIDLHDKSHEEHGPEGPDGPEGPGRQGRGHTHSHRH